MVGCAQGACLTSPGVACVTMTLWGGGKEVACLVSPKSLHGMEETANTCGTQRNG